MAKQNNNQADGGEPVKGGGVTGGETPAAKQAKEVVELTPAQKFAAKKKADLKAISDEENAAFIAEQKAKKAAEKEKLGIVEEDEEELDEKDYSTHNSIGNKLKAKLAAAKAEATKSIPAES